MTFCATCKWSEDYDHSRTRYPVVCGCPEAALPVLRVNYVTGGNVYAEHGDTGESRPPCRDVNVDGECQWWETRRPQGEMMPEGWSPLYSDNLARDVRPGSWLAKALKEGGYRDTDPPPPPTVPMLQAAVFAGICFVAGYLVGYLMSGIK